MKTIYTKDITTSKDLTEVIELTYEATGNTIAEQLLIQVEGTCKVTISGKVSDSLETKPLMLVDMASLEGVSEASAGIYTLPVSGLTGVELSISGVTGTAKVVVKGLL